MGKFIFTILILIIIPWHCEMKCQTCPAGTKRILRCKENAVSNCVTCDQGSFNHQETSSTECRSCTTSCGVRYQTIVSPCTPRSDSVCQCKTGYWVRSRFDIICQKHTQCARGFGVSKHGTPISNVECEVCMSGTYSPVNSSTQICQPHTSCVSLGGVKRIGNSTHNNVCQSPQGLSSTWIGVITGVVIAVIIIIIIILIHCIRKRRWMTSLLSKFSPTHTKTSRNGSTLNNLAGEQNIEANQFMSQHSTVNNLQPVYNVQTTVSTNHDYNMYDSEEKFVNTSVPKIREVDFYNTSSLNRGGSLGEMNEDQLQALINEHTEIPPNYSQGDAIPPPAYGAVLPHNDAQLLTNSSSQDRISRQESVNHPVYL